VDACDSGDGTRGRRGARARSAAAPQHVGGRRHTLRRDALTTLDRSDAGMHAPTCRLSSAAHEMSHVRRSWRARAGRAPAFDRPPDGRERRAARKEMRETRARVLKEPRVLVLAGLEVERGGRSGRSPGVSVVRGRSVIPEVLAWGCTIPSRGVVLARVGVVPKLGGMRRHHLEAYYGVHSRALPSSRGRCRVPPLTS
jgi:hypothetical protein